MSTTKKEEIIDKTKFALAALNSKNKTFTLHMVSFVAIIYLFQKALITSVEMKKVIIPTKYLVLVDVFFLTLLWSFQSTLASIIIFLI